MKVKHSKTGKVYDIDWKGIRPPTDADIDKIAEDLNRPGNVGKNKPAEIFQSMKEESMMADPLGMNNVELYQPYQDPSELKNTRKYQGEISQGPGKKEELRRALKVDGVDDMFNYGRKIIDWDAFDKVTRDFGEKIGIGRGSGPGIGETFKDVLPSSVADIALLASGIGPGAKAGTSMAGGLGGAKGSSLLKSGEIEEAITKFADKKIGIDDLKRFLVDNEVSPQKVQDLLGRVGIKPREVGLSARDLKMNPRNPDPMATNPRAIGTSPRQEALQEEFKDVTGGNIKYPENIDRTVEGGGSSALSAEELSRAARGEKYYKVTKSGQITYYGSQPDPTKGLRNGEAIIRIENGKPSVSQSSGWNDAEALATFGKTEAGKGTKAYTARVVSEDPKANLFAYGAGKSIDLNDLPENVPQELITEFAKANKLDEDAVRVVLQQNFKQQQVRKARAAVKASRLPQAAQSQGSPLQSPSGAPLSPVSPPGPPSNAPGRAYVGARGNSGGGPPGPPNMPGNSIPAPANGPMQGPGLHSRFPGNRDATTWENIFGVPKSLKSVIDLPFLRQTVTQAASHPIQTGKALKNSLKAFSEPQYNRIMTELEMHPRFQQMKDLGVLDPDVSQQFPSNWAEKIPGVRQSEQMYTAGMDTLRSSRFDDIANKVEGDFWKDGNQGPIDPAEYEAIAKYVSDATGRGSMGALTEGNLGKAMNLGFYSPKFRASRFSLMNPKNYTQAGKYASPSNIPLQEARRDASKYGAALTSALGAGVLAGADVEIDPRSSDFLQAQFGNTRLDLTGGMRPIANMAARSAAGFVPGLDTYKSARTDETGQANDPDNPGEYLANAFGNAAGNVGRYARTGLAPGVPSVLGDLTAGKTRTRGQDVYKDVVGRDISDSFDSGPLKDIPYVPYGLGQISPMYPQDIYKGFEDLGAGEAPLAALGFLGAGQSTFGEDVGSKNIAPSQTSPENSNHKISGKKKQKKASRPRRVY